MATENTEKVQERTKKYALEVEKEMKDLEAQDAPIYWRKAELNWEVSDKKLWQILGHDSARAYIESLYISRSGFYARRRQWGDWAKPALEIHQVITRAKLNRMPAQNVNQLLRLDEKRRFNEKWVEKALNMKESDLEAAVDHVLENNTEPEDSGIEDRALLKVSCTISQKEFILETFAEFAKSQDPPMELDDEGRILELICAEVRSGLPSEDERKAGRAAAAAAELAAIH